MLMDLEFAVKCAFPWLHAPEYERYEKSFNII